MAEESRFWRYFHDNLAWAQIFSPGPLACLIKGMAASLDEARQDMILLREQFTPETADGSFIEGYGASRGIIRTRLDTSDSYHRRVINAFVWHKLGGKTSGLAQILAENGFFNAAIGPLNMIQGVSDAFAALHWAHFAVRLDVPLAGLDQDALDGLLWLVNEYKPARSKLWAVSWQIPFVYAARIRIAGCVRLGVRVKLYPQEAAA